MRAAYDNPYLAFLMSAYTVIAYLAITCHMTMVKEFGGIATVVIGNARKALTIVLSFALFPKTGSWLYILGGLLVFGSLTANAYMKEKDHAHKHSNNKDEAGVTKRINDFSGNGGGGSGVSRNEDVDGENFDESDALLGLHEPHHQNHHLDDLNQSSTQQELNSKSTQHTAAAAGGLVGQQQGGSGVGVNVSATGTSRKRTSIGSDRASTGSPSSLI
jgi:hypothetical protein